MQEASTIFEALHDLEVKVFDTDMLKRTDRTRKLKQIRDIRNKLLSR